MSQYNIVLELAEFDMSYILNSDRSPVFLKDIYELWGSMIPVVEGIQAIHQLSISTRTQTVAIQG
jgi:hypothetical protein